jgi:hypothetical protein
MIDYTKKKSVCPPFMPLNPRLAYAYIAYQCIDKTFIPDEALEKGTAFPELFMPYKYVETRGGDEDDND